MFVDTYADVLFKTSSKLHRNIADIRIRVRWGHPLPLYMLHDVEVDIFLPLPGKKSSSKGSPPKPGGVGQQKLPIAGRHCCSRGSCSGSWYALARYWNGSTFDTTCCGAWSSDFGAWSSDSQHACAKGREIWEWFEWSDKHGWIAGWRQWDDLVISRSTCHKKWSKHRNDENGKNGRY